MAAPTKTVAFFGATGGCANKTLIRTLDAGYHCIALARNPQKLRDMCIANGVSEATVDSHLRVVRGDAKDMAAVRATIAPVASLPAVPADDATATYEFDPQNTVSNIVSGIGMIPFSGSPDGSTICQVFAATLRQALDSFTPPSGAPFLAAISTTGITAGPRDVPLLFLPLYYLALHIPHKDKRVMEEIFTRMATDGKTSGTCLVRPSLLMDWAEQGTEKIRVGDEKEPAVGYFISRLDVGNWVYERCIADDGLAWSGKKVSLTN